MTTILKDKRLLFVFPLIFLALQFSKLGWKRVDICEGWFSDIAYHLNSNFNGWMGNDLIYGSGWSSGNGKLFFLVHHVFYKLFGVGLLQARVVTFISGIILLILLYRWTKKHISQDVAVFSTLLLALSPLFGMSLPDARYDVLFCTFAFLSFYLISSGVLCNKNIYFLFAGLSSAMSIDLTCYRGINIVLAVYIFHCVFFRRETFLKRSALLLLGSLIAFIYWVSINVLPIGLNNFIEYHLVPSGGDVGFVLLSEIKRVLALSTSNASYFLLIEVFYLIALTIVSYRYRLRYKGVLKVLLSWLIIVFIVMSLLEQMGYRTFNLLYNPFLCVFSGICLCELFKHRKKLAYVTFVSIMSFLLIFQGSFFTYYFYHKYLKKDYDVEEYFEEIRSSVDTNKSVFGITANWYAFPDTQYYGGLLYLLRVITVLKELKLPEEYKNDYESAKGLLDVFKKRKIEYIIACEQIKAGLLDFFSGNELPSKNFLLVDTVENMYMVQGFASKNPPYKTEIYKIISYEP